MYLQVLPSVLQCLPLKEDFEENKTVFECLFQLYLSGDQEVNIIQYFPVFVGRLISL